MSLQRPEMRSLSLPSSLTGKRNVYSTYGEKHYVKKINQYIQLSQIGTGSFSKVFVCIDTETEMYYALKRIHLKQLKRSPEGMKMLQREIEMMRRVSSNQIVTLHEVLYARERSVVYLVLEYADCGSIASVLKSGVKFTPDEIRYIFKQIVDGVADLHDLSIVHQDLKPQNVLLCHDWTVLISDFGIGHTFQSAAKVVGTPAFQAPEVIDQEFPEDDFDPGKEDIWSLGITLYFLNFNELPFDGCNVYEIVHSIYSEQIKRPEGCDNSLWSLLKGMLNVNPMNRYDINQVKCHEYVSDAPFIENEKLVPNNVAPYDTTLPIRSVHALVLEEEDYPFIDDNNPLVKAKVRFSAPDFAEYQNSK